jgi:glycosyltransferase involved in cell wall biosynthesis
MRICKIGIIVMHNISVGSGGARVVIDLINGLNSLGSEVSLLTPFKLDFNKIKEYYGEVEIKKIYNPGKLKSIFCKESILSRKILKKEFQEMAKNVEMMIDIDGGVLHNYLPNDFDKNRYVIWRITRVSQLQSEKDKWSKGNAKKTIKNLIRDILRIRQTKTQNSLSRDFKIYAVDNWTKEELIKYWELSPEKICLYPEIKVNELLYDQRKKKKNQIIIFGRIAPNKRIGESIKIFYNGTKKYPDYNLVILGGATVDSEDYIKYLKELINKFGISERVKIIRNPGFDEIKEILLDSKILIESEMDSLTMTAIEAMAAGCVILSNKASGTFQEVLDKGKFGYGFEEYEDGSRVLEKILEDLKKGKINNKKSIERTKFFSHENFIKRLKLIIKHTENQ